MLRAGGQSLAAATSNGHLHTAGDLIDSTAHRIFTTQLSITLHSSLWRTVVKNDITVPPDASHSSLDTSFYR
jgi:hypothetical protein